MILAVDTETNGVDLRHSARPFLVTTCTDGGEVRTWEWEVDPLTRTPAVPRADLTSIRELILSADELVLHNSRFDVAALASLDPAFGRDWPWDRTHDTLTMAHLLNSNRPKDLTSLSVTWLAYNGQKFEDRLEAAVKHCRRAIQQQKLRVKRAAEKGEEPHDADKADWMIADDDTPGHPSCKGTKTWRFDYWLPRAFARACGEPADSENNVVLREYADSDSQVTVFLFKKLSAELKRKGDWKLYEESRRLLPIVYGMESGAVTIHGGRTNTIIREYTEDVETLGAKMVGIAAGYDYELKLPAPTALNNNTKAFIFDVLNLPVVELTAGGNPSLDKTAMEKYSKVVPKASKPGLFVNTLAERRKKGTAISYAESYRRFWQPLNGYDNRGTCERWMDDWFRLYPSLNLTGTDTLRGSSSHPNGQNISKQDTECPRCGDDAGDPDLRPGCYRCRGTGRDLRSLRYCFGPAPGREWWSLDFKNLELRLPFYRSNQQELIALFEEPDAPPFYGSNHFLNFSVIYPDLWDAAVREVGPEKAAKYLKKKYKDSWYQWCKNGNFAIQYNAGRATADAAYHRPGCFDLLKTRFTKLEELNQLQIGIAEKRGFVETMPDRTVDPTRGYPLLCTRTESGRILNTVPLSYYVQGTAMWLTRRAMVRTQEALDYWLRETAGRVYSRFDGRMTLQVHDEIVLDLPRRADPRTNPGKSNLGRVKEVAALMARGGTDLLPVAVPTPVGIEYHNESWADGWTAA